MEGFQKENIITKSVAEGLKATSPRTSRSYIKPKIHKQGNPKRPYFKVCRVSPSAN